jgi:hypothetical protein
MCLYLFIPVPDSIQDASALLNREGLNFIPGYFIESSSSYSGRLSSGTPFGNSFALGARSMSNLSGYRLIRHLNALNLPELKCYLVSREQD